MEIAHGHAHKATMRSTKLHPKTAAPCAAASVRRRTGLLAYDVHPSRPTPKKKSPRTVRAPRPRDRGPSRTAEVCRSRATRGHGLSPPLKPPLPIAPPLLALAS